MLNQRHYPPASRGESYVDPNLNPFELPVLTVIPDDTHSTPTGRADRYAESS